MIAKSSGLEEPQMPEQIILDTVNHQPRNWTLTVTDTEDMHSWHMLGTEFQASEMK